MMPDWFDVVMCLASAFLAGFAVCLWFVERRYGKELRRVTTELVALRCRAKTVPRR